MVNARSLAIPNRGHSHFPHDFRSSYECPFHYLLLNDQTGPPVMHMLCLRPCLERLTNFEHVVQSLSHVFLVSILNPKPLK